MDLHNPPPSLTITVPIFNEEQNIVPLYDKVRAAMDTLGLPWELVLVDDGSRDGSAALLDEIAAKDPRVTVVHFARNYGQTAAMMAGMDHARGDIIVPMDGDLQNDPGDIGRLLEKLAEGFDVVSGWRKDRQDHAIKRNLPSRLANTLISRVSGVHLHDYGCSLKAYRREVLDGVKLYGEMHRFVPIYAAWNGARVTEIPVSHHPRLHGESKYGLERIVLLVGLREVDTPDDALRDRIKKQIRTNAASHHGPVMTPQVSHIRRTISGKISELAARAVIHDETRKYPDALANPEALALYRDLPVLAQTVLP